MNRATARTMLRRRINEETAVSWTDSELNDFLDVGLQQVQTAILAVDPEANLFRSRIDIVADQALYEIPSNLLTVRALKKKNATSGLYEEMAQITYARAQAKAEEDSATQAAQQYEWARFGRFFWLTPTPTAAQSAGLELDFVPLLTWGDDVAIPPIPTNLHYAAVLRAVVAAKGESSEDAAADLAEYGAMLALIPSWYRPSAAGGAPDSIQVDVGKRAY